MSDIKKGSSCSKRRRANGLYLLQSSEVTQRGEDRAMELQQAPAYSTVLCNYSISRPYSSAQHMFSISLNYLEDLLPPFSLLLTMQWPALPPSLLCTTDSQFIHHTEKTSDACHFPQPPSLRSSPPAHSLAHRGAFKGTALPASEASLPGVSSSCQQWVLLNFPSPASLSCQTNWMPHLQPRCFTEV